MKKTKEIHLTWAASQKFPELKINLVSIVGKWHYHYENKNGKIGLIRCIVGIKFTKKGNVSKNLMMWETCGVLNFQRFDTKKEAEIEIYKTLKEKL